MGIYKIIRIFASNEQQACMKRLLTTALFVAFCTLQTTAQYISKALPIDIVMSSLHINSITQDDSGFLWMGSSSGLFRFDGYSYQKITAVSQPELLPEESVLNVSQWGGRYLWIQLRGELYSCYDLESQSFVDWSGNSTRQLSYHRSVIADDHNIWLYDNKNGVCHVAVDHNGNFSSERFYSEAKTLPSNKISFVIQDMRGNGWIGTDHGLVCARQGKTRVSVKNKTMVCAQKMADGTICFLTEQGEVYQTHKSGSMNIFTPPTPLPDKVKRVAREGHQLVVATGGATYCYDVRHHTVMPHPTIHINDAQVVEDNRGNKVVFDYYGTDVYYITPEKTYHMTNIYSQELVQKHGGGRFVFVFGSRGNIWVSTYSNGLFAYNRQTGQMNHYTSEGPGGTLIDSRYLFNLYEDHSGQLWVCQENMGVRCIIGTNDKSDTRFFTNAFDLGHANTIRLIKPCGDKVLVGNYENELWTTDRQLNIESRDNPYQDDVVAAASDRQGRLWVGTRKRGVFVDGKPLKPAVNGKVSDILCDKNGRVWISIFDGDVVMLTPGKVDSMQVRHFFRQEHAIAQPRSMIEGHSGRIWLCSNGGVYSFMPGELIKNDRAYRHTNISGVSSKLDEVHCLFEDSKHRIWAGTEGHGLAVIDSTGAVVRRYTDSDGLPNNRIESIIEDAQHFIWAGTDNGLARYSEADDRFNAFFLSNHILGLKYTEGCAALLQDGRLAMGTRHGMQVFRPADITPRSNVFPLALTNITVNGVSLLNVEEGSQSYSNIIRGKELRLDHNQNSLTFFFSLFDYVTPQLNRYAYRLENYDKEWSTPTTYNFAVYKNLKPGTYKLHVRSYNRYGVMSEHEAIVKVVISQPWWNTWWAWLVYLLFIGAFGWTVWRQWQHTQDLRLKIKLENQLTEYKLRFFTNVSHEFRTPLTIIRGAMERISSEGDIPGRLKQPISSMQKSTDRMLRLVNELLEFRKIQNKKLRLSLEETDIIDFLRNIFLTFNETAENHRINYQFTTFAREYKMFVDRNYVDKMAYNLLSNAFKYTPHKGTIIFRVKENEGMLTFEVEDTGIGVPREKQPDLFTRFNQSAFSRDSIGIGLHMVSEMVKVHHGIITYREAPEGGSIFAIALPTDMSIYQPDDFLSESQLLNEQDESASPRQTVSYKEISSDPMNDCLVLVVDDDDDMRDFISGELLRFFNVTVASNGEEALEKIAQSRPHLIISDVKMPGMGGIELLQKVRQQEELADIPFILLTAITDEEKMVRGTKYGADDYLYKPFNCRVLVAKCAALIAQRDKLRQHYAKEVVGSTPLSDIIMEDVDKKFLDRFENWVDMHMEDPNMQILDFANSMKLGRTTFFKKVKQVTGMSPNEYIRKVRMERAAELLKDPTLSIAEVSYKTGFSDHNYFSRTFKDYFGITASQFRKGG